MKLMKSLMLASALAGSVIAGGSAFAAVGDPSNAFPYCKPLNPSSLDELKADGNPLKSILEKESNPDAIVGKLLDPVAPLSPEQLEKIYQAVFASMAKSYWDDSKLDKLAALQHKFDGKLQTRADLNAAVAELINSVNDRWTWVRSPTDSVQAVLDALAKRAGFGIAVRQQTDGSWFIEHISYASGAQAGGFREGDTIISVGGKDVAGMTKAQIDKLFTGQVGSSLTIKSVQDGKVIEKPYTITAPAANEASANLLEKNIAYFKLPSFMSDEDFQKAVGGLIEMAQKTPGGIQGAVLDLRFNGGGSVDMAKTLLKLLVGEGTIINEESRDGSFFNINTTKVKPLGNYEKLSFSPEQLAVLTALKTVPLVVLVNGSSASASEIVTGALMESRKNTTVIGEQSFGKFEEMIVMPLPDCSQVAITSGRYTTPSGRWLHNAGITPDEVVHQPRDSNDDAQMAAAMALLEKKTGNNPVNIVTTDPSKQAAFVPPERAKPVVKAYDWKDFVADYRLQLMQGGVAAFLLSFLGAYLLLGRRKKDD